MAFLTKLPNRNQELDPENPEHHAWIRAKRKKAKTYALLTTMISGDRLISEFARLKKLHASSAVPKAACRYWVKLQEIYRPNEETDDVAMEEELRKLALNHTEDPERLALRIAAVQNKHRSTMTQKRKLAIITCCGMVHYADIIHMENKLRQLAERPSIKASPDDLIKAMHDCWILRGKGKNYNPPKSVGMAEVSSKTNLAEVDGSGDGKPCSYCGKVHGSKPCWKKIKDDKKARKKAEGENGGRPHNDTGGRGRGRGRGGRGRGRGNGRGNQGDSNRSQYFEGYCNHCRAWGHNG